jgi:ADP-heptose:LPS heptosyltransferase
MGIQKKVLTFRASSVGDCLMGKYLLENVHAAYPSARCGIVVANHGDLMRDLFAAYPWLEVIEANRKSPRALWQLWKNFHGSDLVVTQYAGKEGGRFALASKLAARILAKRGGLVGFADAAGINELLYSKVISFSRSAPPASLERGALRAAGIPLAREWPALLGLPQSAALEKFNLVPRGYIIVHLFSGNKSRGLHPDKKRKLLEALHEALPDVRLVISGRNNDRAEASQIAQNLPITVIAGETTLQELMNLINESRGVVSIDTGIAHVTAQLGKPLVVLTSCLGLHWWQEGQYKPGAPIAVFSRAELCAQGHVYKDYPDCLGEISISEVVYTAGKALV